MNFIAWKTNNKAGSSLLNNIMQIRVSIWIFSKVCWHELRFFFMQMTCENISFPLFPFHFRTMLLNKENPFEQRKRYNQRKIVAEFVILRHNGFVWKDSSDNHIVICNSKVVVSSWNWIKNGFLNFCHYALFIPSTKLQL